MPLVLLVLVIVLVWVPFRRTVTGRTVYAIGSSRGRGLHVGPAARPGQARRLHAVRASSPGCGGLFLAIQTSSGNADIPQAGAYTLNSIAAVVIGGTSLLGGAGGAIGSVFGALILRVISFNFRIFDIAAAAAAAVRGPRPARRRQPRRRRASCGSRTRSSCSDEQLTRRLDAQRATTGRSSSPRLFILVILARRHRLHAGHAGQRARCSRPTTCCSSCRSAPSSASSRPG